MIESSRNLDGEKILFIGPAFHHYHTSITKRLKEKKALVHFIPTFRYSLLNRARKRLTGYGPAVYYKKKFAEIGGMRFDRFFLIKGENIPVELLERVTTQATFSVMYQWDSIQNCAYLHLVHLFDKVYSFDRKDSDTHKQINYQPLFYEGLDHSFSDKSKEGKFDLITVAGYTSWRYEQVNFFYHLSVKKQLRSSLLLYIPLKTLIRLWLKGKRLNRKILTIKSVSKERYELMLQKTGTVLDIPSPSQSGLSIRTIESLAKGCKLITTNKNIVKEEFYSPETVFLLDTASNIDEVLAFIQSEHTPASDMQELELGCWLDTLLFSNKR